MAAMTAAAPIAATARAYMARARLQSGSVEGSAMAVMGALSRCPGSVGFIFAMWFVFSGLAPEKRGKS
jgi:hypothetical protein